MKEALIKLLQAALKANASDIHLTIENHRCSYEFRVNGQLIPYAFDKKYKDDRLFHYLKYISHCELANLQTPQTGSFDIDIDSMHLACRFALLSTRFRQAGVIRLLNKANTIPIDKLCPDPSVTGIYQTILKLRYGLVLISGPTGSGKTTTSYSLLNAMQARKIYSIEDPIEIYYPFMMQVQINEKSNMDYGDAIKQIMRHDPDVIFIGEIRDEKAANMALRCALTGHLVIATIHAGSCVSTIQRMLDLNVDKHQFFDNIAYITSQLLVNDASRNIKFSAVELLDKVQIQTYQSYGHVDYETLDHKLKQYGYYQQITY